MAVNLSKNGAELTAAYKDVVDSRSDTNWALFTYEGNSNNICVAGTGGGGLEEMVEELSSGKVMYAFCRVHDPNSGLPKYVLINWTGEGVKDSRKGACASHLSSLANFLKGAHVTINARAEDDVEPETILAKVAKASGANFNFHAQMAYRDVHRGPVGSVYRKINAVEEIQQLNKDEFWTQTQLDEDTRQQQQNKRVELERQRMERERRDTEEKQASERVRREMEEKQAKERVRREMEEKQAKEKERREMEEKQEKVRVRREMEEKQAKEKERREMEEKQEKVRREVEEREAREREREREREEMEERNARERVRQEMEAKLAKDRMEQERIHHKWREQEKREDKQETEQQGLSQQEKGNKKMGISFTASVQKANEAKSLISQRSFNPRDIFKQREKSFESTNGHSPATRRTGKLQSPFLSQKPLQELPASSAARIAVPHISPVSPAWSQSSAAGFSPTPAETTPSPDQPADDAYMEDEEWSDEFDDDEGQDDLYDMPRPAGIRKEPYSTQEDLYGAQEDLYGAQEDLYEAQEDLYGAQEDLYEAQEDLYGAQEDLYEFVNQENPTAGEGQKISARALYDYQAADDTEITFDPNDIITGIDMMDEGWWRGYGPDGHYGMFPANYVELIN